MTPLRDLLRDGDPVVGDAGLSEDEGLAMRRRVMAEVAPARTGRPVWQEALALGVVIVLMVAIGVTTGQRMSPPADSPPLNAVRQQEQPRQLQFATPGGTRIIWTFDPEFSLKESMP